MSGVQRGGGAWVLLSNVVMVKTISVPRKGLGDKEASKRPWEPRAAAGCGGEWVCHAPAQGVPGGHVGSREPGNRWSPGLGEGSGAVLSPLASALLGLVTVTASEHSDVRQRAPAESTSLHYCFRCVLAHWG